MNVNLFLFLPCPDVAKSTDHTSSTQEETQNNVRLWFPGAVWKAEISGAGKGMKIGASFSPVKQTILFYLISSIEILPAHFSVSTFQPFSRLCRRSPQRKRSFYRRFRRFLSCTTVEFIRLISVTIQSNYTNATPIKVLWPIIGF